MMKSSLSFFKPFLFLILFSFLTGCASFYVDGTTKEIPSSQFKKKSETFPVTLIFEFQTKGVANQKATDYLKDRVFEQVKSSGLFSEVETTATPTSRVLSIVLNNVPVTDDAFSKGFVTGLTFGLAGSEVTDGYVCTAKYIQQDGKNSITKKARHALHATIGAKSAPENAVKAANMEEAVTLMTHQIISNVLNDISHDALFE
jgi:hypothetical protein